MSPECLVLIRVKIIKPLSSSLQFQLPQFQIVMLSVLRLCLKRAGIRLLEHLVICILLIDFVQVELNVTLPPLHHLLGVINFGGRLKLRVL